MKKIFKYSFIVLAALVAMPTAMNAQTYNPDPDLEPGDKPDGIEFTKTTTKLGANDYRIDIETYVTGSTTQISTTEGVPIDVIYVLDESGSMDWDMEGNYTNQKSKKRVTALKNAVKSSLDELNKRTNLKEGQFHKASIIGFSGSNSSRTIKELGYVSSSTIKDFKDAVDKLDTGGGTYANKGMERAVTEAGKETDTNRPIIVILFTDGIPGGGDDPWGKDEYQCANNVITQSAKLKGKNVKVYTIGIFDEDAYGKKTFNNINAYMGGASSNYPNATKAFKNENSTWSIDTENLGAEIDNPHFYKITTDADELKEIFTTITRDEVNGSAATTLTATTTANIDIMSSSFKLPDNMPASDVELYVAVPTGVSGTAENPVYTFGPRQNFPCSVNVMDSSTKKIVSRTLTRPTVTIDEDKQEVIITGFDYSGCYVSVINSDKTGSSPQFTGCKLIISFHININPENPGGANEPTNDIASGLYVKDEETGEWNQIAAYQQPTVNNPNLVIVKNGLHKNESAVFTVKDVTTRTGHVKIADMTVVATCTEDGAPAITLIKVQDDGRYTVTENAWSWAYNKPAISVTKSKSSDSLNSTNASITRDVDASTEDDNETYGKKGTYFIFTNSLKENNPAHGEGYKNNVFSGHKEPTSTTK